MSFFWYNKLYVCAIRGSAWSPVLFERQCREGHANLDEVIIVHL